MPRHSAVVWIIAEHARAKGVPRWGDGGVYPLPFCYAPPVGHFHVQDGWRPYSRPPCQLPS